MAAGAGTAAEPETVEASPSSWSMATDWSAAMAGAGAHAGCVKVASVLLPFLLLRAAVVVVAAALLGCAPLLIDANSSCNLAFSTEVKLASTALSNLSLASFSSRRWSACCEKACLARAKNSSASTERDSATSFERRQSIGRVAWLGLRNDAEVDDDERQKEVTRLSSAGLKGRGSSVERCWEHGRPV